MPDTAELRRRKRVLAFAFAGVAIYLYLSAYYNAGDYFKSLLFGP